MNTTMINYDNFDYVIEIPLNEAQAYTGNLDPRTGLSIRMPQDSYDIIRQSGAGSSWSFGNLLRNSLPNTNGYSCEVSDFGDAVTVRMTYTNVKTCRSASKSFVIIFLNKTGKSEVKSSSARWRTCNDYSQAASYIKSKASSLQGKTSSID